MSDTYWHFLSTDRRLRWGTRELVEVGKTITVDGELKMCAWGLHASKRALDALEYSPGPIACLVTLSDDVIHHSDKSVASSRTCIAMVNATDILWQFARAAALSVLHKWDAPQIVIDYLLTGREDLRDAARDAAWAAARVAARAAAFAAAQAAARVAARDAAWVVAQAAARVAARDAAWVFARDAAWDAARNEQNDVLEEYLLEKIDDD